MVLEELVWPCAQQTGRFLDIMTYDEAVDIFCCLCIVAKRQGVRFLSMTRTSFFPLLKHQYRPSYMLWTLTLSRLLSILGLTSRNSWRSPLAAATTVLSRLFR